MIPHTFRQFRAAAAIAFASLTLLFCAGQARAEGDAGFDPNVNGNIYATLLLPDGGIVIGGSFTELQPSNSGLPVSRSYLARFNSDGSLDESFQPVLDGDVLALALDSDGTSILVAGKFKNVNSTARQGIARLTSAGVLDAFDPAPDRPIPTLASVDAIAVQNDGKILLGGAFQNIGGEAHECLARVNQDGTIDSNFRADADNVVFAIAIDAGGNILVGGGFTTITTDAAHDAKRIARLGTDGAFDAGFAAKAGANNRVLTIAIQADGRILAGGNFTKVGPDDSESDIYFLARFGTDGTPDASFKPQPNAYVSSLAVQRDGKILAGGNFKSFYPSLTGAIVSRSYFARLLPSGQVDSDFSPGVDAPVAAIALQSDDRIVIGGYFSHAQPSGATFSVLRHRIARVEPDGSLDSTFAAGGSGLVTTVAKASNGLLVAGLFDRYAGVTRHNIALLDSTGKINSGFAPDVDGEILAMVVQGDGNIIIGGTFTHVNGTERDYIARLSPTGVLDESFNPKANSTVYSLVLTSDDKIFVGGSFTAFYPNAVTDATARTYLARLKKDGSVDSDWTTGGGGTVYTMVLQSDSKLLLGTSVGLLRLNTNGSTDTDFTPGANGAVLAIALDSSGNVVFGGTFTTLQRDDGENDDDDGDTLTNDDADRLRIARIDKDGKLDQNFNPALDGVVRSITIRDDGKLLVGGLFTSLTPKTMPKDTDTVTTDRSDLVLLTSAGVVDTTFALQSNDTVYGALKATDGSIYLYGAFTDLYTDAGASYYTPEHVARLTTAGAIDSTWLPEATNSNAATFVGALARQEDGHILVGGKFSDLIGGSTTNLARLLSDGNVDSSFAVSTSSATGDQVNAILVQQASASNNYRGNSFAWLESSGVFKIGFDRTVISRLTGRVNAIAVDLNGKILLGGSFADQTDTTVKNLIRLNTDGSLDSTFQLATPPNASVAAIVVLSDGKILVSGAFTNIAGTDSSYIARLTNTGAYDTGFTPTAPNGAINALAVQSDGQILVGGSFTTWGTDATAHGYFARLSSAGVFDSAYKPLAGGTVASIVVQSDGKIVLGGSFTTVTGTDGTAVTRNYLARVNTDSSIDTTFNPSPNGAVNALNLDSSGNLIVGGNFTILQLDDGQNDDDDGDGLTTDDADWAYVARIKADGTLDTAFRPTPNAQVLAIALQSDGKVVLGGSFSSIDPGAADSPTVRNHIARVGSTDGALDLSFNPNANDAVYAITALSTDNSLLVGGAFTTLQPDYRIYVGGKFSTIGDGVAIQNLARLNLDGNPDSSFQPAPDGAVNALAEQSDGSLIVAGAFTKLDSVDHKRLARFSAGGELDAGFVPNVDGEITALALGDDDSIYIGGTFQNIGGIAQAGLAHLTADGALNVIFAPTITGSVDALVALPGGGVLVGGGFTQIDGDTGAAYLARINADGTLDTSFKPGVNAPVHSLALQSDGSVILGGDFTSIGGTAVAHVARIEAGANTVDTTFTSGANGAVYAILLAPDGRPLLTGAFTQVNSEARYLVARVSNSQQATSLLSVGTGLNTVTWTRSGSAPHLSAVKFSVSTDGNTWSDLGDGTRLGTGGSWTFADSSAFADSTSTYYVRARGILPANRYGSGGVVEAVSQFYGHQSAGYSTSGGLSTATGGVPQNIPVQQSTYDNWKNGWAFASIPTAAASADADHDGWSNLAEYAFTGDPLKAETPAGAPGVEGDGSLTFAHRVGSTLVYQVQYSTDLSNWTTRWQTGDGWSSPAVSSHEVTGTEFDLVTISRPSDQASSAHFFWRVLVIEN